MSDEELMKGMKVKWEEASPTTWQEWRQTGPVVYTEVEPQSEIDRLEKHLTLLRSDRDIWIDRYADSQNTMAIWRCVAVVSLAWVGGLLWARWS